MKMPPGAFTALVVDDTASIRRQLAATLRGAGLYTFEADDGAAAWRWLQDASADIIITDLNMPRLDGLKLIGLVRGGGRHRRTPIVVVTTEAAESDRLRAMDLGATAYLPKPVAGGTLVQVVERLLAGATTA